MNYDQMPTCKCGNCTCDWRVVLEKRREDDKVHQFLLGLDNAVYGGVRTSIISTDPLPVLNNVYSKIKSVEWVQSVMWGREEQGT